MTNDTWVKAETLSNGKIIDVYEVEDGEDVFWDIYEEGELLNEGIPFWELPSLDDIENFLCS